MGTWDSANDLCGSYGQRWQKLQAANGRDSFFTVKMCLFRPAAVRDRNSGSPAITAMFPVRTVRLCCGGIRCGALLGSCGSSGHNLRFWGGGELLGTGHHRPALLHPECVQKNRCAEVLRVTEFRCSFASGKSRRDQPEVCVADSHLVFSEQSKVGLGAPCFGELPLKCPASRGTGVSNQRG